MDASSRQSDSSFSKLALLAILLPIASLLAWLLSLLCVIFSRELEKAPVALIFVALTGILTSIPFGAVVGWAGRKKADKNQARLGFVGCIIGIFLTFLWLLVMLAKG